MLASQAGQNFHTSLIAQMSDVNKERTVGINSGLMSAFTWAQKKNYPRIICIFITFSFKRKKKCVSVQKIREYCLH